MPHRALGFKSFFSTFLVYKKTNHKESRKKPYRTVACGIAIWSQSILQVTQNILIFIVLELA